MKHFKDIENAHFLFYKQPESFNKYTTKDVLANALGATMYTPATDKSLAESLIVNKHKNLTTRVWCLEDAIADTDVEKAEANLVVQVDRLNEAIQNGEVIEDELPLLFIRVRSVEQLQRILKLGNKLQCIAGFNIPKFSSENGEKYLSLIQQANKEIGDIFYAMPILETKEVLFAETRAEELMKIKQIIDKYKDYVLNIRLGGTDFSSHFGIRRSVNFNIYDIRVIEDCLISIMNVFGRAEDNYTVSGVVWEYFPDKRLLKPQLREAPFAKNGSEGLDKRQLIIAKEIDGLIKEIILDKANGFCGKTVIHPCHIPFVNALQCVTYEEYMDAIGILGNQGGGVFKGDSGNKMNECKPHLNWAKKIYQKSKVYGVMNEDANYTDLF